MRFILIHLLLFDMEQTKPTRMLFQKLNDLFSGSAPAARPDVKTAVAELLVHASQIDGHLAPEEVAVRDRLLREKFGLDDKALAALTAEADKAHDEAVDFYRFTKAIKQAYDRDQRETVVEMLVEILLADGKIDEDEMNMGWRIAGLLGFDNREWVNIRKRVEDRTS
jgi:uncharacterized tellurite resistance protein B-like protein